MSKTLLLILSLFALALSETVIYMHNGESQYPISMDFSNVKNSPSYMVLDCTSQDCTKYVKLKDYPSLYYWKGPGSAFERVHPPTYESMWDHLKSKEEGIANQLRMHFQTISLLQMLIYTCVFAYFLFTVFTFLFSPPKTHKRHHKKH